MQQQEKKLLLFLYSETRRYDGIFGIQ